MYAGGAYLAQGGVISNDDMLLLIRIMQILVGCVIGPQSHERDVFQQCEPDFNTNTM